MKMHTNTLFSKIKSIRNTHKGRRVFIIANGPSINSLDLSKLSDDIVIGMNASSMLLDKHKFEFDFYVVSDFRFLSHPEKRKWATTALSNNTRRILRSELKSIDQKNQKNTFYIPALERDGFSKNIDKGYFYGCTTTMLALQLAYYIGASDVYLLGCDLRYPEENPRFYRELTPQVEDSFTSVQIKNIVDAANLFNEQGKTIYSLSPISFLRGYLPYIDFNELF